MLRITYSIVISALLIIGSQTFAKGTENTGTVPNEAPKNELQISVFQNTEDHRYIVSFKNDTEEPVKLSLKDEKGNDLYTENITGKGIYNKRFDLVNLEDGEYTVTVGNQIKNLEKEVVIK